MFTSLIHFFYLFYDLFCRWNGVSSKCFFSRLKLISSMMGSYFRRGSIRFGSGLKLNSTMYCNFYLSIMLSIITKYSSQWKTFLNSCYQIIKWNLYYFGLKSRFKNPSGGKSRTITYSDIKIYFWISYLFNFTGSFLGSHTFSGD